MQAFLDDSESPVGFVMYKEFVLIIGPETCINERVIKTKSTSTTFQIRHLFDSTTPKANRSSPLRGISSNLNPKQHENNNLFFSKNNQSFLVNLLLKNLQVD